MLGVAFTAGAAALLSLALITQRYALAHAERYVSVAGIRVNKHLLWFGGLILYGIANGMKVLALQWGPLSVLSCIFTLVLVWNLVLARLLLREVLTPPKVVGALTVVIGAGLASVGACRTCQTKFTASEVVGLLSAPPANAYVFGAWGLMSVCSYTPV